MCLSFSPRIIYQAPLDIDNLLRACWIRGKLSPRSPRTYCPICWLMYNWSSAAYIYMRLSWLFLWPTFHRKKSDPAILCRQQTFLSRPRAAIVPYRHVDRDNILLRWYQLPCIGAVQPQTVPHIVIACLSMDVCALVTSSSSSWLPPNINLGSPTPPLWHAVDLFGPALAGSWHPPKKCPNITHQLHTHTGLIRNERRKSKVFARRARLGNVHNLYMRLGGFWTPSE
jgi:hypothetical protein